VRLLVASDTPFLPPTAGNRRRIREMIEFLGAAGVEVGLVLLPAVDRAEWDEAGMRARVPSLRVAEPALGARVRDRLRRLAPGPPASRPIPVDAWCPRWFRAAVRRHAEEWRADAVLVEYVYLSACLPGLPERVLRLVDTHDVMHRRVDAYAGAGLAPRWFHTSAAEERRGLARADVVLAIREEEAAVLRALVPEAEVLTVPHGCPVAPAPPARALPGRLLFVGSYNDLNVEGLRWFADRVWPALCARRPGVELHVCGTIAAKLGAPPAGVRVRGALPALDEEYAAARVVIDPVAWGTGQPIKVIEALAHGRPVVSRRAAPAGTEDAVVEARDEHAFAAAIAGLLDDDAGWRRRAAAAAGAAAAVRCAPEAAFGPLLARLRAGRRPPAGPQKST
jgi:succinoglycan biosynthesis protein ExoO